MSDELYTLSHREYIGDVLSSSTNTSGSSSFSLLPLYINPGNPQLFPWGSTIAMNYSNFRFRAIKFEFISTSATALNSTNTALGLVFGRVQGDATISPDVNSLQMLNSHGTHKANPSQSWQYIVDCTKTAGALGTMSQISSPTGLPSNQDSRLFYPNGFFELASQGMQANNVNLGQLYVTYVVDLIRPVYLQGELGYTMRSAHYWNSTYTNALPLGGLAAGPSAVYDNIGLTVTGTVITFPVAITTGVYKIDVYWTGGAVAWTPPTLTFSNCSAAPAVYLNQTQPGQNVPGGGSTAAITSVSYFVTVNAPGNNKATVTFSAAGTLPTAGTNFDLIVTQVNGKIV